jgi:hypothetical protein
MHFPRPSTRKLKLTSRVPPGLTEEYDRESDYESEEGFKCGCTDGRVPCKTCDGYGFVIVGCKVCEGNGHSVQDGVSFLCGTCDKTDWRTIQYLSDIDKPRLAELKAGECVGGKVT